ncbi:hypothetical protein F7U66_01075 [Vibrio parahaemolyticus]|nr:hypothetical protein [Vibrio parahaemolyticus]
MKTPFNIDKCRFIKNKHHCWEIYDENAKHIVTTFPNLPKDAVKSLLKFAISCYQLGYTDGQDSNAYQSGYTKGLNTGKQEMKESLKDILQQDFPETFQKTN